MLKFVAGVAVGICIALFIWSRDVPAPAHPARTAANEIAAIATLRNVVSAQAQFQAVAVADANSNGEGEYGTFEALAGGIHPPVLSEHFRKIENGRVERGGYYFKMFIPDNPVFAEKSFRCYAWPVNEGRTFYVDEAGVVLSGEGYLGNKEPVAETADRSWQQVN